MTDPADSASGAPRVLVAGPLPPPVGGMATYVQGYLGSEVARRFSVRVLRLDLVGKHRFRGLARRVMNVVNFFALTAAFKLTLLVRWPRIVHIHANSFAGFYEKCCLVWIARFFCRRVVIQVHGGMFRHFYQNASPLGRWVIRFGLRMCHRVVAASAVMGETYELIGVRADRVALIPNPVALPAPAAPAATKPAHPGTLTVLFLGRLDEAKGVLDLLEAAAAMREAFAGVRLRLAGPPGDATPTIAQRIADLGLGANVELVGEVSGQTKERAFADADVFVLPSHVEDMPYALLEAMAHALPCVASAVGGVPTIVTDRRDGLLVPPRDSAALTVAIGRLLRDPALRRTLGDAARKTIEERFSWDRCAGQVITMYNGLLHKSPSAKP